MSCGSYVGGNPYRVEPLYTQGVLSHRSLGEWFPVEISRIEREAAILKKRVMIEHSHFPGRRHLLDLI
jgi:hypothetical protein